MWSEGKGNSWTVEGPDGVDTLKKVEALRFDDYTLYLDGRNNDPYAQADEATTDEDNGVTIDVLANDFDGDEVSVVAASSATEGVEVSINADGTLNYNPGEAFQHLNDGETAVDIVTYEVSDGNGGTATQTVAVTVTGVTDQTASVGIDFDSGEMVPGQYPWSEDYIEDGFHFEDFFMGFDLRNDWTDPDPDNEFTGFAKIYSEDGGTWSFHGLSWSNSGNFNIQGWNGDGQFVSFSAYASNGETVGTYLSVGGGNVMVDSVEEASEYFTGMETAYLYGYGIDDVQLSHDAVV